MKKILALAAALCLLCLSVSALAEDAINISDGSPLEMEDFTLNLEAKTAYLVGKKASTQIYLMLYPFYAKGDAGTNISFTWTGDTAPLSLEEFKAQVKKLEDGLRPSLEQMGYTLEDLSLDEPVVTSIAGAEAYAVMFYITLSYAGASLQLLQCQYYVPSKNYVLTFAAGTQESLDSVIALLDSILVWN